MEIEFTREEISHIEKNLGFIVFDWMKNLIGQVISKARSKGVKTVYMNTSETLEAGGIHESKSEYFYEKLPPTIGFQKETINLRGNGEEPLWAYHLDTLPAQASSIEYLIKTANNVALEEIPKKYQGAFIGMIGRKKYYTQEEIKQVFDIVSKKEKKKAVSKFYYDWESSEWSGEQRFRKDVNELVVIQRISPEIQSKIEADPILLKFWGLMLSEYQHFGVDAVGFALVSPISSEAWVINEVQTDALSAYNQLRRLDRGDKEKSEMTWDTLKDMLTARNRTQWIWYFEENEDLKNEILQNPNLIEQLPDNVHDIGRWISDNPDTWPATKIHAIEANSLNEIFKDTDFSQNIFRT